MSNETQALASGPDLNHVDKTFSTLRARLAMNGYALNRSDAIDGPVMYYASRWGLVRELSSISTVEAFAQRVGAQA